MVKLKKKAGVAKRVHALNWHGAATGLGRFGGCIVRQNYVFSVDFRTGKKKDLAFPLSP